LAIFYLIAILASALTLQICISQLVVKSTLEAYYWFHLFSVGLEAFLRFRIYDTNEPPRKYKRSEKLAAIINW
jgi:hypothetical protein